MLVLGCILLHAAVVAAMNSFIPSFSDFGYNWDLGASTKVEIDSCNYLEFPTWSDVPMEDSSQRMRSEKPGVLVNQTICPAQLSIVVDYSFHRLPEPNWAPPSPLMDESDTESNSSDDSSSSYFTPASHYPSSRASSIAEMEEQSRSIPSWTSVALGRVRSRSNPSSTAPRKNQTRSSSTTKTKPFSTFICCGQTFTRLWDLGRHNKTKSCIAKNARLVRSHPCPICSNTFARPDALLRHQRKTRSCKPPNSPL
ncbi:hypothetical protein C8J56DRAFT_10085 [Mycena floridula]|nr:hypothetical protein C8J56DRAFT_10085 [Mycena floridula]